MSEAVVGPVEVSDPETLARIGRLRFEAWHAKGLIVPDAFPGGVWRDPLDAIARHFVIEVDGRLAASMRYAQFDRMDDMPEAAHYRKMGLDLDGPVGLPERLFVAPGLRHLRLPERMADKILETAHASGARWLVTEATPPMVAMLLARGRQHIGPAAHDPRFPTVDFQLMLTDVRRARS